MFNRHVLRAPEGDSAAGAGGDKGAGDAAAAAAASAAAASAAAAAAGNGADKGADKGAADAGTKTVLNADAANGKGAAAGKWPDDWRQEWAGEDADYLKQLERFASPADAGKAYKEARARISQGFKPEPFPTEGTEEAKKEWRQKNGVPETPDGYLANLPDGIVIGEEDKADFDEFAKDLHASNLPPQAAHLAVAALNRAKERQLERLAEGDTTLKASTEDVLRSEWGGDYRANIHVTNSLIEKHLGEEDAAAFMSARTPDGKAVFNIPSIVKMFATFGRELLPAAAITPSGEASMESMATRKAEIEKLMRTNRAEYNKDAKAQSDYRKIIEAEQRIAERTGKTAAA
jgi:hypothetical protein